MTGLVHKNTMGSNHHQFKLINLKPTILNSKKIYIKIICRSNAQKAQDIIYIKLTK